MSRSDYDPLALRQLAVSESGFVFDPRTGHTYDVNATGLRVLEGLRRGLTLEELAEQLRRDTSDAEFVEEDLQGFLGQLIEFGLTRRTGDRA